MVLISKGRNLANYNQFRHVFQPILPNATLCFVDLSEADVEVYTRLSIFNLLDTSHVFSLELKSGLCSSSCLSASYQRTIPIDFSN